MCEGSLLGRASHPTRAAHVFPSQGSGGRCGCGPERPLLNYRGGIVIDDPPAVVQDAEPRRTESRGCRGQLGHRYQAE
jgi:hypothetical protein